MADGFYILKRSSPRSSPHLDDHGQPKNRRWNAKRLDDRSVDEFLGVCRGLVADGSLSEEEILFLQTWLNTNKQYCRTWPVNVICARLEQILDDDIIDLEERTDLFDLISKAIGHDSARDFAANLATTLPLTKPAPPIFFKDKAFSITGRMVSGCRKHCEEEITMRSGSIHDRVTMKTDYLIIGLIGSSDWLHTTHGRKIEYAVRCQEEGSTIAIISEEHWRDHLL